MNDFEDFLNASGETEDQHLAKRQPQQRQRGGSPSYRGGRGGRGAGRGDDLGFGRGGDPYASIEFGAIEFAGELSRPKSLGSKTKAGKHGGGERSEPASSPSAMRGAARSKGGATPSAKSEPAKAVSDSESSGAAQSEAEAQGGHSLFASYKADIDQQLRESQEELKRQEEERERKKKEEEERKQAEEAKRKEEEKKKAEEAARLEEEKKREAEEAKKKEQERKKREEEEAKKEEERQRREAEEAKKKEEAERQKCEEEEEEEIRKQEEQQRREAEAQNQERLRQEAEARKREEDRRREAEEEQRKREEEQRRREAEEVKQEQKRREAEAVKVEESQKAKEAEVEKKEDKTLPARTQVDVEKKKEDFYVLFILEIVRTPTASLAPSSRAASPSAPSVTFPAPPDPSPRIQSPSPERPPPPLPASRSPSPASQTFPPVPQSVPPAPQLPRTESSSLSPAVGAPRVSVQSPPPPKAPQVAPQIAPQAPQVASQPTRSVSSPTPRAPQSNQAPRLPLPARTLEVPEEGRTATNSLPFMPHDLHSRSASVTVPLGAAPGPAHPSDRWCLPCEDGKLLVLRSTESAEQQEMNAYWRSQARGQVLDPPRPERPEANASLLMSSATSERSAPSPGSHGQSHAPDPALLDLAQRVDRMKLEACQGEIQGLKKKLVLLEEFNTDLAKLKTTAEAEAMQLDEQLMRSRMENKKLQDWNELQGCPQQPGIAVARDERSEDGPRGTGPGSSGTDVSSGSAGKQAVLSQRVASLTQELAGLREERDTLKEDLALCGKENVDQTTSSTPQKLKEQHVQHVSPNALLGRMQAELAMSEKMLRACEKENENLAQQNRQLRQGARLQREEVDGRQLQLVAELNAAKAEADANPASMRRLAEVERELVATKERAEEHARELERCREAKRQLEREIIAGPPPKAPNQELEQMEARCALAQSEVAEMQEKLRYYAQSQQAMEEDRRQVEKLSEELRAAKTENGDLRRRPGLKEASKKIAELRRQNEELNECLRKRNPDSILALIKACEPAPEEKRELRDLKGRIAELEAQLQERDAMYDRRIRGLRAQYDHMRHEYERRSETKRPGHLGPDLVEESRRVGPDHEAVLQARIKDLERQVEHTKSYYLTKLRKREPLVPPWKPSGKSATQNPSETRQIQQLQQQLQEREHRIAELESARAQSPRQSPRQTYPVPTVPTVPAVPGYPSPPAPPAPERTAASSLIRLFMASPEGSAMVALCTAQHWLAQSMRLERYDEVAAHAEMLIPIFLAAESAAKGSGEAVEMDMSCGTHRVLLQHDALRLEMPLLPSRVWNAWRHAMQRVAVIASQASLAATHRPKVQLLEAIAELRQSAEAVIQQLLPDGPAPGESMLPRLSLEAVREDLDQRCEDQALEGGGIFEVVGRGRGTGRLGSSFALGRASSSSGALWHLKAM
eukprot:s2913_g2.t1